MQRSFIKKVKEPKECRVFFIKNLKEHENVAFFWKECKSVAFFWKERLPNPAEKGAGSSSLILLELWKCTVYIQHTDHQSVLFWLVDLIILHTDKSEQCIVCWGLQCTVKQNYEYYRNLVGKKILVMKYTLNNSF